MDLLSALLKGNDINNTLVPSALLFFLTFQCSFFALLSAAFLSQQTEDLRSAEAIKKLVLYLECKRKHTWLSYVGYYLRTCI
jgi:endonuclease III